MKVVMKSGQEIQANDVILIDKNTSLIVADNFAVHVEKSDIKYIEEK